MENNILFEEIQTLDKQRINGRTLLGLGLIPVVIAILATIFDNENSLSIIVTMAAVVTIIFIVSATFSKSQLIIQIKDEGIYISFPPLIKGYKIFRWEDISEVYVRNYDALGEYSGWGIKIGPSGESFTIAGNEGLQIKLKNNYSLLIGTMRGDEIENILRRIDKLNPPTF